MNTSRGEKFDGTSLIVDSMVEEIRAMYSTVTMESVDQYLIDTNTQLGEGVRDAIEAHLEWEAKQAADRRELTAEELAEIYAKAEMGGTNLGASSLATEMIISGIEGMYGEATMETLGRFLVETNSSIDPELRAEIERILTRNEEINEDEDEDIEEF
jgi:hypothetical protein